MDRVCCQACNGWPTKQLHVENTDIPIQPLQLSVLSCDADEDKLKKETEDRAQQLLVSRGYTQTIKVVVDQFPIAL